LEIIASIGIGGRYGNSPMRHRNSNTETLSSYLISRGLNVAEVQKSADIFVALDHSEGDRHLLEERKKLGKFSVLFRSEPRCVLPEAYKAKTEDLYETVISFGKPTSIERSSHWPQYWLKEELYKKSVEHRSERVAMINANKLNLSKFEMYTLRRMCALEVDSIDLYGESWNSNVISKLKTLIIEILKNPIVHLFSMRNHVRYWFRNWPETLAPSNKQEILRTYKYTLVIENDRTYMSEKLFDALIAGCIPVYVGPSVVDYGIPGDLVIQVEPTVMSVASGIEAAKRIDFMAFQERLDLWLSLETTEQNHLGPHVIDRVIGLVNADYENFKKAQSKSRKF
jgi:hypothetical protein